MTTGGPGSPGLPGEPGAAVPVCPRHPDRESYVRCQRCGRPTCPECQREAPVGVQCVDCVAQARREAPAVRTALGGRARGGRPVVTLTLIGACVVMYVLQVVSQDAVTNLLAFYPPVAESQPWRYLTSAFLHSPGGVLPLHLLFNMYVLYLTGPALEQLLGRGRFLALYLVSAFGGSVAFQLVWALTGGPASLAVGASGAVFGSFGALLVVQRRMQVPVGQIGVVLAINLVLSFVLPGIAWEAHLGGLATGAAVAALLVRAPRRPALQVVGVAAVAAVWLVLAVVASLAGP
ncbi:rhomboid family intramembrane serine protease [uncultured Pseudokineococcus sp.]|uniref:rhomboid family intramembrane serine protease n=1 Tax=uncultured Pseudokineococcus sp. TaxID=1642928 RepID=UPI0026248BB2|nr:rhomboid family intramembrane serine protease [uncultured Pseudokineococcus sp.]